MSHPASEERAVPLAVPAAWSKQPVPQAAAFAQPSQSATTTATPSRRSSIRVGRRALSAIRSSMSERDWQVLRAVADHRYLTTRHIEGFCFADHATPLTAARVCRRVLRRLHDWSVLTHLERRVGGVRAGSASYVWQVGRAGQRLLATESAEATITRPHEPGLLFLGHCLAVADAHLSLIHLQRRAALELITVQTEPRCWRRYSGLGGARLVLQPDLYVVTGAGDFEDHWFVEVDLGTEHPKRLLAKCHRYEDYRHTGIEQADGGSFPLVVWAMRDQAQADRLRRAIATDNGLDGRLFRVTTGDDFAGLVQQGAA